MQFLLSGNDVNKLATGNRLRPKRGAVVFVVKILTVFLRGSLVLQIRRLRMPETRRMCTELSWTLLNWWFLISRQQKSREIMHGEQIFPPRLVGSRKLYTAHPIYLALGIPLTLVGAHTETVATLDWRLLVLNTIWTTKKTEEKKGVRYHHPQAKFDQRESSRWYQNHKRIHPHHWQPLTSREGIKHYLCRLADGKIRQFWLLWLSQW